MSYSQVTNNSDKERLQRINKALLAGNEALELLPVYRKENRTLKNIVAEQKQVIAEKDEIIKNSKTVETVTEIQYRTIEVRNTQLERELPQLKLNLVKEQERKKNWRKVALIGIPVSVAVGGVAALLIF